MPTPTRQNKDQQPPSLVIVNNSLFVAGLDKEVVVQPRVPQVVHRRRKYDAKLLQLRQAPLAAAAAAPPCHAAAAAVAVATVAATAAARVVMLLWLLTVHVVVLLLPLLLKRSCRAAAAPAPEELVKVNHDDCRCLGNVRSVGVVVVRVLIVRRLCSHHETLHRRPVQQPAVLQRTCTHGVGRFVALGVGRGKES